MEVIGNEIIISMVLDATNQRSEGTSIAEGAFLDFLKDSLEVGIQSV